MKQVEKVAIEWLELMRGKYESASVLAGLIRFLRFKNELAKIAIKSRKNTERTLIRRDEKIDDLKRELEESEKREKDIAKELSDEKSISRELSMSDKRAKIQTSFMIIRTHAKVINSSNFKDRSTLILDAATKAIGSL